MILFKNANDDNTPTSFNHDSKLVAAGYATTPGMSVSNETWHDHATTVEVTVTDDNESSFDGKTYGVITVTNLGAETLKNLVGGESMDTGAELANYLQATAWTESSGNYSNFIMSTHNDQYGSANKIFDQVTLKANATSENAPETTVHVERLAAKIRLAATDETGVSDFIYPITEGQSTIAKVRLEQVKIVNRLNSGSYLLKRVSENVTDGSSTIPEKQTNGDNYLGNEVWQDNGSSSFNYVIDPWTRNKTQDNLSNISSITSADLSTATNLLYLQPFSGDTYNAMWGEAEGTDLSGNIAFANSAKVRLAYTMENTTSATMSKNGYSTGAVFKATYFPKEWAATTTEDSKQVVKAVEVDYDGGNNETNGFDGISSSTTVPTGFVFYEYNGNIYKDHEAIFNEYAWAQQQGGPEAADANSTEPSASKIYSYSDFTAANIANISKADFQASVLANYPNDPFGYIQHLLDLCKPTEGSGEEELVSTLATGDNFTTADAIETFISNNAETINATINKFENGVCYYTYWIRHAGKQDTEMQPMEFAIVRNNIYDLSVDGITGLGTSGITKPDPGKDNESTLMLFRVRILVKNWVVRSNSGIML